jgi:hypothetical protein
MIVSSKVRFRGRRDPFPYDMSADGGPVGTSYSFEALDEDDAKVKIKCSESQWTALAQTARDAVLLVRMAVQSPKIEGADGISAVAAAAKPA